MQPPPTLSPSFHLTSSLLLTLCMCTSILRRKLNKGLCLFSTKLVQIVHTYTPTRTHEETLSQRRAAERLYLVPLKSNNSDNNKKAWALAFTFAKRPTHTHTHTHSIACIVSGRVWVWHYLAHSWLAIWALKSMLCESLPFISIIHVQEKARERERDRTRRELEDLASRCTYAYKFI